MIGEEGSEGVNTLDVVGKGRQLAMPDQRMSVDLYIMLQQGQNCRSPTAGE